MHHLATIHTLHATDGHNAGISATVNTVG